MVNYWKSRVLPKIKKVFGVDGKTRLAAAEANKAFDESKETITKEFEEKKAEIGPKVIEIYQDTTADIKLLVKNPTLSGLKNKNLTGITKFFDELVKIDFPGAKTVNENITKFSPALVFDSVVFIFEKVAVFVPTDEPASADTATTSAEVETREINVEEVKRELVITEDKKEEISPPPAAEPTPAEVAPTPPPPAVTTPAPAKEPEKPAETAPPAVVVVAETAKPADSSSAPAKTAEAAPAPAKAAAEPVPAKAAVPAKTASKKGK